MQEREANARKKVVSHEAYYELHRKRYVPRLKELGKYSGKVYYHQFRQIVTSYFAEVVNEMLEGNPVIVPKLGEFRFVKSRMKRRQMDYANTKKHNKLICHVNFHTDGYVIKSKWKRDYTDKIKTTILGYNYKTSKKTGRRIYEAAMSDPHFYKKFYTYHGNKVYKY